MYLPKKQFVKRCDNTVIIGNRNFAKFFHIKNGHLNKTRLVNRRIEPTLCLTGAKGSEEFIITLNNAEHSVIRASDLTIGKISINDLKHQVKFYFKSYLTNDTNFKISMTVTADSFVARKRIGIAFSGKDQQINYIDMEHIVLGSDVVEQWSHPDMAEAYLTPYQTALGQPVYLNGMFTGCEFPATDNNIINQTVIVRYFCGKSLSDLGCAKKEYTSWPSVLGAAHSLEPEIIRADFLDYIRSISRPISLRTQYNSWYDHMLDINDENINKSFFEIEKNLTQNGIAPLDAYVVDDGWVNYDADFWSINSKFPNDLCLISDLAKKFSSEFGLWLGPRGGYNRKTPDFARRIEKSGKGAYNAESDDICITSRDYIKNITDFFVNYTKKYDVGYWKLDGFMRYSCHNPNHGHPVGGSNDMYCFTDCWENWIHIFKAMRKARSASGKQLWINMTSYCNASPWHLQFCESFWMQNSSDIGFIDQAIDGEPLNGKDFDRMLTYRDTKYFDFCRTRNYQFPLSNLFNHEPIYGNSAHIQMSDEDYRNYMYMLATRGTAFWELYYSYSLFSPEKWQINTDVLHFLEENFDILQNARLIGNSPEIGAVYGYSSWNSNAGIISLRNPTDKIQRFCVKLDELIGVPQTAKKLCAVTVLPYSKEVDSTLYSYNDTLNLTLESHGIKIFKFTLPTDCLPVLYTAKFVSKTSVEFRFDQHIVLSDSSFLYHNKPLPCRLDESYRNAIVSLPCEPKENDSIEIEYLIHDLFGRSISGSQNINYYKNDLIPASCGGIFGSGDFTVLLNLESPPDNGCIFCQSREYVLSFENRKVVLRIKGIAVAQQGICNAENLQIAFVRERNGMIKIYINGTLSASAYNKNKVNATIKKGKIRFDKCVKEFQLLNHALSYDELNQLNCERKEIHV